MVSCDSLLKLFRSQGVFLSNEISRDNTITQGQGRIIDLMNSTMSLVFNGDMSVDAALRDLKTRGDQFIAEDLRSR